MSIIISDLIIQKNKLFLFRDLLNFTMKCIGGQIRALSQLLVMQKVHKVESVNIKSDCEVTSKKRTDSSCVFTQSGKVWKGEEH